MANQILNFSILKQFGINTRIGKVMSPMLVFWRFPDIGWIKLNTDGAGRGASGFAACGSIFKGSLGEYVGSFPIWCGSILMKYF